MFCQVTKESLIENKDSYYCQSLGINYPIKNNIVFMGYKAKEKDMMIQILLDSQHHQGTAETLKNHNEYMKISYPLIAQSISTFKKLYGSLINEGGTAVNVGSGGDPSSNEIAYLGFDTYACEIEPNSLFISSFWENHIMSKATRIACDCFRLPFPDSSVNFIYCKEFLHHIENYNAMINEFSRILKLGGVALIIEPTLTHRTSRAAIEFPGHHYQINSNYLKSFRRNGFSIDKYYIYSILRTGKFKYKIANIIYNYFIKQFSRAKHLNPKIIGLIQQILDGQNVWYLKKTNRLPLNGTNKIEKIELINSEFLTIDKSFFDNIYFEKAAEFYIKIRKEYHLMYP